MAKADEPDPATYELADDGGVVDLLTRDTLYFLDMVFAANINDKDEHCQLAVHDGCDLWMAELVYNETHGTLTMNDLASVYDNGEYGEWFADLAVTDKTTNEFLVYYTRYDPDGTGEAGKNSIGGFVTDGDDWVVYSLAYGNISQANYPAIAESTDYLAYTAIETNGDKNVMRDALNAYHTPTGSPVQFSANSSYPTVELCEDDASDPVFIQESDTQLVYHCPSGDDHEVALAARAGSSMVDRTDNEVIADCGHLGSTADSEWIACTSGGDLYVYDTAEDPTDRYLNTLDPDDAEALYIGMSASWYESNFWSGFYYCTGVLREIYVSFGDSSDRPMYTAMCENQEISKIFWAYADPTDPPGDALDEGDVFYISGFIEDYLKDHKAAYGISSYSDADIEALEFCTADYDMYF